MVVSEAKHQREDTIHSSVIHSGNMHWAQNRLNSMLREVQLRGMLPLASGREVTAQAWRH